MLRQNHPFSSSPSHRVVPKNIYIFLKKNKPLKFKFWAPQEFLLLLLFILHLQAKSSSYAPSIFQPVEKSMRHESETSEGAPFVNIFIIVSIKSILIPKI